jgi:hypothetical protein
MTSTKGKGSKIAKQRIKKMYGRAGKRVVNRAIKRKTPKK